MAEMYIRPLSESLGAEITGARIAADLGEAEFRQIEAALHEHLVIVIRDQQVIIGLGFYQLARVFVGRL